MGRWRPHPRHDPIRWAYEVETNRFSLGGRLDPAAIRDQMVRACLVVDRMVEAEIIKPTPAPPLAVIGAGAAGVTAALRALDHDVSVLVLYDSVQPFHLQAAGRSRRLDPTLYDWPAPHWAGGSVPLPGTPSLPLGWWGASASAIANEWNKRWELALRDARLEYVDDVRVTGCRVVRSGTILLDTNRPDLRLPAFSAVVDATGQGEERTCVDDDSGGFRGVPFWCQDEFESWDYGRLGGTEKRGLIGGGGDGALQDLLRLTLANPAETPGVTPFSTKALFVEVQKALRAEGRREAWKRFAATIAAGEDQAARAGLWVGHNGEGVNRDQDYAVLRRLDSVYTQALDRLLGVQTDVSPGLRRLLGDWQRKDLGVITLAHRGPVFGRCYPVNRVLAHLLDRFYHPMGPAAPVRFRQDTAVTRVIAVEGSAHRCEGKYDTCLWQPHLATLRGVQEEYDLVILRHGAFRKPAIPGFPPLAVTRHLLPYHVPWPMRASP